MDDESRDVSLRLCDVLDRVGVSERMRLLRRKKIIYSEIQHTVVNKMAGRDTSVYIFGSSTEGTATPGMNSDSDMVHCHEQRPIIHHLDEAPLKGQSLLSFSDNHTKPGYAKLQLVQYGILWTVHNCTINDPQVGYDNMGRVCFKHFVYDGGLKPERGGPAYTFNLPGVTESDMVSAIRSRTFPREAVESLQECTRTGWLTKDDVEEMIQYGCFYVGVGHPSSEEEEYEWRISFSFQERKLMFKLNSTQHNCYVLLKFIKNMLTSKPDIGKSITSYHCKTCLFRVISKTHTDRWTPANLILCTFECLNELLQCLRNGNCANFFIKTNNMFERRVGGEVKERLIHYLRGMINEGFPLFYRIQSDSIGEALRGQVSPYIDIDIKRSLCIMTYGIYQSQCESILGANSDIARYIKRYTNDETTRYLFQQLCYLSSVNTITEHTQDETKAAVRDLEPVLHRLYAANLASLAFSSNVHVSKHRLLKDSDHHLKHAMTCDLMSGRLLHASILYRQGNIDTCCNLLDQIEQSLHDTVLTMCGCHDTPKYNTDNERIVILSRDPEPQSMMSSFVAACMIFLPSHTEIMPTALQYELYRSVATPPGSRIPVYDGWFDLAVVDSKVYLYFMQYLVYSRLNRPAARRIATDNLMYELLQEWNLGHRESGYNLLGWIYSQEGQIEAAANCFLQSWMIRPHHNAAKWHMLILMYRLNYARQ